MTQEHHVFVGTLRENLALAAPPGAGDEEIRSALEAVDALEWVDALPDGLDTVVGSGGRSVTAAQAQQLALARLVLADPHTLVLDEATSLIDPRTARHLEGSMAALLTGRTVIAIAHLTGRFVTAPMETVADPELHRWFLESRGRVRSYMKWWPHVAVDLHEQGSSVTSKPPRRTHSGS